MRAAVAFAAVTLLLSVVTAVAVWATVSRYLTTVREKAVVAQAVANADQVERSLDVQGLPPAQLISQLPREIGSSSLLVLDGQ